MKQFKRNYLWRFVVFKKLVLNKESYLHSTGWVQNLRKSHPCSKTGLDIPWMNYPVINFMENRLQKDFSLFEFGSGYSTYFYSRLFKKVHSVEYDKDMH